MAEMPDRINAAAMYDNPTHGVWDTAPEEGTPYIRADLVDELVKALEEASGTGVHIGRGEYSISQEAMQAIDAALTRIKRQKET